MKIQDILKSASANLLRSKGRTILTIIAIFIGTFTIALTSGVNIGVNDYIDKQVNSVGGEGQLLIQPKVSTSFDSEGPEEYSPTKKTSSLQQTESLDKQDLAMIKKNKKLKNVQPLKTVSIDYIAGNTTKKYVFSAMQSMDSLTIDLANGKKLNQNSSEYEINLAPEYVKALGFKSNKEALNKTVKIAVSSASTKEQTIVEAKIVGIRNTSLIQGGVSLLNNALIDKLSEVNEAGLPSTMKDQYMMISAEIPKNATDKEITKIKADLDKSGYSAQTIEDEIGMIRNVINAITGVLTMFGAIALLAASFGIINTLYMSVQERTREIGLMKAMGLSSFKVFSMFSVEAILIGFWGSLIGIAGAWGASLLINHVAATSFLDALSGFTLIQFSLQSIITIMLLIMFIAFLAGTLPARKAAKQDPIDALRYE